MKAKKILIDGRMYGLEYSGIGRYLMNLVKELINLDKNNQYTILLRKKRFNSLNLPKNWSKVLADVGQYTLAEQIKLPVLIRKQEPDLVHFPHFNIPVFWKGKFIVTIHDMTMHKQGVDATNLSIPSYYLKRIPYKFIFNKAVKDGVKIITPTQAIKKEISEYFKINEDKIVSIYEGFDDLFLEEVGKRAILKRNNINCDYFIYAGNVYPHKNLKRAIEAIVSLNKSQGRKIILVIVGSRDVFLERIENYIRLEKAQNYVKTLGFIPDQDLVFLYKNSIGFVYPSLSEGFGLQGLEVMASGTLLLASDIPVFKEVYGDNSLFFNPFDFSAIAKAMEIALEMKEQERSRRIEKAKKFVQKYSWTKMAKETLKVYGEIINA